MEPRSTKRNITEPRADPKSLIIQQLHFYKDHLFFNLGNCILTQYSFWSKAVDRENYIWTRKVNLLNSLNQESKNSFHHFSAQCPNFLRRLLFNFLTFFPFQCHPAKQHPRGYAGNNVITRLSQQMRFSEIKSAIPLIRSEFYTRYSSK